MKTYKIAVCFGKYRKDKDGLGEFCYQIGHRLAERADELIEKHNIQLYFHLKKDMHGFFGGQVKYLKLHDRHRVYNEILSHFDIWHSLHQHISQKPPLRVGTRLLTMHDLNYLYGPEGNEWNHWNQKMKEVIGRNDALITISHHVAKDIRRHTQWRGALRTIHNGARNLLSHEQEAIPSLAGKKFFFHLSRMAPSKNPEKLVGLAIRMPDMHFVMAGPSSDDTTRLSNIVKSLGIRNVSFHENISEAEKTWLYAHAEAFLFPSLTEGFGLPPIEAMKFGCPVFLSNRTCLPEVGGSAAAYWTSFDLNDMEAVLRRELPKLQSPEGRSRSREHAAQFEWNRCADDYINAYLALIHRRRSENLAAAFSA
jgi:glycosyltransferase involved in cell wall biosynthesis